jgi:hypothetical protein
MGFNRDFFLFGGKIFPLGNKKKKRDVTCTNDFLKKQTPKISMFCRRTS